MVQAWEALRGTPPPETISEHPVDALYELIPTDPVEIGSGFEVGLGDPPEDPWRIMVVGREPELSLREWVFEAAQLLVVGRGTEGEWIVVDEEEDPLGSNRVYLVSEDGKTPRLIFTTIDDFVEWIVTQSQFEVSLSDQWSDNAASVEKSIEALWQVHPADLFLCYRMGTWPAESSPHPKFTADVPGWRRAGLIWTLAQFWNTREVGLPQGLEVDDLSDVHRDLNRHLRDLQDAIALNEVPVLVADLALDDDQDISQSAMEWMIKFDRALEAAKGGDSGSEEASSALAEKTKGVLLLLQQAVDELIRLEYIELPPKKKSKLIDEMLEAVIKAGDPYATVPKLIETLLESSHVEEVYAEDSELKRIFSMALGLSK